MGSTLDRTVLDGFAEWVEKAPDQPAVMAAGRVLTYRELDAEAGSLARDLADRGAGPETVVALSVRRTVDLAVAMLAVVKAGAAYLPLDPDHPAERVRLMIADSGAALVLTETAVASGQSGGWGENVAEFRMDTARTGRTAVPVESAGGAASLLYVIYTSGSTGKPKGIAMHAGPQITLLDWCRENYATQPRVLQYYPITADVAFLELMSTWWLGGCAVITSERDRYDVESLAGLIEEHALDKALLPVVALDGLAEHTAGTPERLATLRELTTTGDRLVITPAIRLMCERTPDLVLDNHYGSTEVNVVTAPRLRAPAAEWPEAPLLGRPMSEARIYVLDGNLAPVPPNVPGDIYVGGGPPARGYLGRPALTADAFRPDPFSGVPGARMYRIGDVGRWRSDGRLEFLGRSDFQIKLRGYRVEPEEIESLLRERTGVLNAVVVARGDDPVLVAYVVAAAGTTLDPVRLREELAEVLPTYMVPQHVVVLAAFPLTDTGKINRNALPEPDFAAARLVVPRDDLERSIAEVFAALLGITEFGVDDSFFTLGGHSLLVTQLVHRLRTISGFALPLRAVFERPTVAGLAELVRRKQAEA